MTRIQRTADERRAQIKADAAAMGIDEEYISTLVDTFYDRVRVHPELGPVFNNKIGDNWDAHLDTLKRFWSSVALNAGTYHGRPVPAHMEVTQAKEEQFAIWLSLFRQTLEDTAATPEAVEYFYERANRIANSLKLAMFGIKGIPGPMSGN